MHVFVHGEAQLEPLKRLKCNIKLPYDFGSSTNKTFEPLQFIHM